MEMALFVGLQASGKTSFYLERFFRTHVRISLDQLRTRHREAILVRACIQAKQPFVVDNTNPSAAERVRYLGPALASGFRTVGYVFPPDVPGSLARNTARSADERIPDIAIFDAAKRFEPPTLDEGFAELFAASIDPTRPGRFVVGPWP
jgi:hypothetical protein